MKKILIAIVFISFFVVNIQAQKVKPAFSSINLIGSVWGANQNVFCFETINGIQYKTWFTGVGLSLDSYGSQSTPIFVDIRKQINKSKLFVYGDAGVNIPWKTDNFKGYSSPSYSLEYNLKKSFYSELGFGFTVPINKELNFITSIGYSYKIFKYDEISYNGWSNQTLTNNYKFEYNRIAFRIGMQF